MESAHSRTIDLNKRTMFMIGTVSAALLTSAGAVDAKPTSHSVYVDGKQENYAAYNINENNYFKLRDIAEAFNIGVKWDATNQRVDVLTNVGYGEEDNAGNTTEPTAPTDPTTPTTPDSSSNSSDGDEDYETVADYRQPGDEGIRSVNMGGTMSGPRYKFYPSYNHYSVQYQNLLDTCGEEIVTKTIYYYTYCGQTQEDGTLSGFPMEVDSMDDRIEHNTWHLAETIYVDSGEGSFELKCPKMFMKKFCQGIRAFSL